MQSMPTITHARDIFFCFSMCCLTWSLLRFKGIHAKIKFYNVLPFVSWTCAPLLEMLASTKHRSISRQAKCFLPNIMHVWICQQIAQERQLTAAVRLCSKFFKHCVAKFESSTHNQRQWSWFRCLWIPFSGNDGKNAALVSNLCLTNSDPELEYQATTMLNENPNAAHHFISSLIRTMHRMILRCPQNWSLKGIFTLLQPNNQQENLLRGTCGSYGRAILPVVPVPVRHVESFYCSAAEQYSVDFHLMKFT